MGKRAQQHKIEESSKGDERELKPTRWLKTIQEKRKGLNLPHDK